MPSLRSILLALLITVGAAQAQSGLSHLGEFKVNTTTSGDQANPRMAMDAQGNFVVAWQSADSNGLGIWAQRYNAACSPIGSQFAVNRTNTIANQTNPTVAMAPDGRFVIVWETEDTAGNPHSGAFGQLYAADGTPQFATDFNATGGHAGWVPSVAMDHDGRFIVAWYEGSGTSSYIWALQFSASGTPVRSPFQTYPGNTLSSNPSVAANASGDFVIVWFTYVGDVGANQATYARGYKVDGTTTFGPTRVFPVEATNYQNSSVALRDDGSFVVAAEEVNNFDGSGFGIYSRRFDASGNALDASKVLVNTATGGNQYSPCVSCGPNGEYVISYRSAGLDGSGEAVGVQRFDVNGAKVGSEFFANTFTVGDQSPRYGSGANVIDPQGNLVFVWQSAAQDGSGLGVYADKFYLPNQGPPLTEFRVNTTTTGDQHDPSVAMDATGKFAVVWIDESSGTKAVRRQHYSANGLRLGLEQLVTTSGQAPVVGMNAAGASVVVWHSPSTYDILAQRYDASGAAVGGNIQVTNDPGLQTQQVDPSAAVFPDGRFILVWCGQPSSDSSDNIHGQLFGADGVPLSGTLQIDQAPSNGSNQDDPDVAVLPDGGFIVAWGDANGGNGYQPHARIYNVDGSNNVTPRTNDFPVTTSTPTGARDPVSISVDSNGKIVLVWESPNEGTNGEIFGRRFNADGTTDATLSFQVNATTSGTQTRSAVAAAANGDFIVTWASDQVSANGFDVYLRRFRPGASLNSGFTVLENEHVVNTFTAGDQGQFSTSGLRGRRRVAVDPLGNYVVAWHSQNQDGSGYGVYATKVFIATPPTVDTLAATSVTASTATLNGAVTPNDVGVDVSFEIATSQAELGTASATTLPANPASLGAGTTTPQAVTRDITGLTLGIGNSPKAYYYRTVATPTGSTATIYGPVVSFTVQNSPPVARDDAFIILGEATLDPIKQSASAGTPGQDTDADPGDTLTINGTPTGASLGTATTTLDHLMISYNPGDLFAGSADGDSFSYTIQDTRGAQASATIHVYSVRALAGTYSGLIGADGAGAAAGRLDITLTRLGQITGSFKWEGQLYAFNQATLGTDGTLVKALPKDRTNPGAGTLQLSLRLDAVTKILTGTLTDTSTDPATVVTAEVTGTATADDLDLQDLPDPGIYSAYIDPGTVSSAAREIPAQLPGLTLPRGLGFSQIIVAGKSTTHSRPARTAGRMPDDQPFASGAKGLTRALRAASGQAKYSLFVDNLYSKVRDTSNRLRSGGVVSGDLGFSRNGNRFDSSLNWERLANPSAPRFQGGIKGLVATLNAIKYGRPPSGTLPAGIRGDHNPNAKLTLTEGDLVSTLTQAFKLTRAGGGGVQVQASGMNPQTAKLSVSAIGGSFKGSFVHPGSGEVVKFNGVFKDQDGQGVFTGPTTTGRIQILAQ